MSQKQVKKEAEKKNGKGLRFSCGHKEMLGLRELNSRKSCQDTVLIYCQKKARLKEAKKMLFMKEVGWGRVMIAVELASI